ncbi:MAG TPA: sigma 54-interacting transcriptional regulator [Verrucomicrobiae bacterium]|jgi:two-component system response regulator PilR (NtrC family)|nr:sigma 54-interacting transcriptional regulator [Verrucomicrobiae bacterium]
MEAENKELASKIKWLLLLRVAVLTFFLGAAALSQILKGGDAGSFKYLQLPLIAAYLISVASALVIRRIKKLSIFAHAQVDFDVLLVTGIVLLTGGVDSPFAFLYNLAIIYGAILLFFRGAFITATFSSVCYAAVLFWSYAQGPASAGQTIYNLVLNVPAFFIIAYLSGFLAARVFEAETLLKAKHKDYLDLEAFKDALVQGIGSGVAITDIAGQINYFNSRAQALTALSESGVKGKKLTDVFPGFTYNFDGASESKHVVINEFAFTEPKKGNIHLKLTLAPLNDPAEQPIGYVGIFEDVTKQKELEEKLRLGEEMRRARERERQAAQENDPAAANFHFEGVVGRGGGVENIYRLVQKVAATTTNVLIMGDSGTGKELVARAIHSNGPRKDRPFVAVNCGAIPENLMESELFGHVRGAFTGAVSDHLGLFKQADGGTIFLDEVGELPLHLQVKMLRVLQEKSFTPVGGSKQIKVDVRVISASNRDLRQEVEKGRFREDLFYRLNVVQVTLPPLRNRKEDIPSLVHYFIEKFSKLQDKKVDEVSSETLMELMNYGFPGNIRELENIIEHSVAVTAKNVITEEDLPSYIRGVPIADEVKLFEKTTPGGPETFFSRSISLDDELATHEKCLLLGALKRANGVQKRAAELLGINYRSFRHRLEKYSLLGLKGQTEEQEEAVE